MYGSKLRFWIIAIVVALLVVVFGVLIFSAGTSTTSNSNRKQTKVDKKIQEYNTPKSYVQMTIDGEVNALENHRQIRVSVSQNDRSITIYSGYNNQVLSSQQFSNTPEAYNVFLHALATTGFLKQRANVTTESTGICPMGTRTMFDLYNDSKPVTQSWTTSCGNNTGNFAGVAGTTTSLFKAQIPNYSTITSGVSL